MYFFTFFTFMSLTQIEASIRFDNLHVFINRFNVNHRTARIIITLENLGDNWFTTKVSINQNRLVDYFHTNTTEGRDQLLWYRTTSLKSTLHFYGIFAEEPLPYQICFYHDVRVNFFLSGYHKVTVLSLSNGLSSNFTISSSFTYIDLQERTRCEPEFYIPRCHDSNQPLHYETTQVSLLQAEFTKKCPMDNFIQYYWTLHDSTESQLLEFLGGTLKPEIKLGRHRLNVRQQSPLNRMVMLRLNARIVGRRTPIVARCYLALSSQRLNAVIQGGQYRKVFRGKTNYINAGPSRDLSMPQDSVQLLLYEWSCRSVKGEINNICRTNMGTKKQIAIPAYSLPDKEVVIITLTIRSTFDYLRTSVAMQTILFSSSMRQYMDVNIMCVSNCLSNTYSPNIPIHIKGVVPHNASTRIKKWSWTVMNKVVGESQRLIYLINSKLTRIEIYLHVEASHLFEKTSVFYGRSNYNMEKNSGPVDSACNINPKEGVAVDTLFTVECQKTKAKFKPLQFCVGIDGVLIDECTNNDKLIVMLPPTFHVHVKICDNLNVCQTVIATVNVRRAVIDSSESSIIIYLTRVRRWLEYAQWQKSFILLYQLTSNIDSKERLIILVDILGIYQPKTIVQLAHIVRLTKRVVRFSHPLDDMKANILARMFHIIAATFKYIIANNELNTLMDEYYETMVNDLCDVLNEFSTEWEFIPKSHCRAESESCIYIDNFRNRLEQMFTLQPEVLVHINNWLHAHWRLSICLFYLGMGTARRLHPEEGPKIFDRPTFTMRMESFDLDLERTIVLESEHSMHKLLFTELLLTKLRQELNNVEVLISIRSHKHTQYWWYPEQESRTQVIVVNAYTPNAIWDKEIKLIEPFQFISKITMNSQVPIPDLHRHHRGIDFDDPQEDFENIIHDNILSVTEVRMYRTELFGHSVLAVTFTKADIDLRVLLRMTSIPELEDMDIVNDTCLVKNSSTEPTVLLLRNRCETAKPVYVYIRASNPYEKWDSWVKIGAYFTFSTEVRICRIWNYARPEPNWQTLSCLPQMNKSLNIGIHCHCNFISDLNADAKSIVALRMNLKCHLERPVIGFNYQIFICYIIIPATAITILFIQMRKSSNWDKKLYVEDMYSRQLYQSGDIIARFTFGGRYNSGSSANIIISLKSGQDSTNVIIYQDPIYRTFERNNTIILCLQREQVQLPTKLALSHDNSGIYPHYFCRSIVLTDTLREQTQVFNINQWVITSPIAQEYKSARILNRKTITPMEVFGWKTRFSMALEGYMGNWFLFQPMFGPWRLGTSRQSYCRWERSCIYISKIFISVTTVVIYFGRTEPIACDPSPKKYNEMSVVLWLSLSCFLTTFIVGAIMNLVLTRLLSYH